MRLFTLLKWYAVLRGVRDGFKPKPPMSVASMHEALKRVYVQPMRALMEQRPLFDPTVWETP